MAVIDSVVPALEKRLPKVIAASAHGVIDYAYAAAFLGLALVWRKSNKPAALAALGTGATVLAQSLLTDYPWGLKPIIPFETHGRVDAALGSASWAIPRALGFSGTPAAKVFTLNSLVVAAVVGLTDFNSGRAHDARNRLNDGGRESL